MQGLQLARLYFEQEALPQLQQNHAELLPYLAAGLVGEGSECFGFDDQISRRWRTGRTR